jgi:putative endonuclease
MSTSRLGNLAEDIAAAFLEMKGLSVIARNYTFHRREIDIVADLDGRIVFVEVKYRSGPRHGPPREAVGREKMRRLLGASRGFLAERELSGRSVRFDVIEVRLERGGLSATIEHIVGAFGADLRGW